MKRNGAIEKSYLGHQLYFLMEDHGGEGMIFSSVYYLDYLSKLVLMLETLAIFTKVKLTKLTKLLL